MSISKDEFLALVEGQEIVDEYGDRWTVMDNRPSPVSSSSFEDREVVFFTEPDFTVVCRWYNKWGCIVTIAASKLYAMSSLNNDKARIVA